MIDNTHSFADLHIHTTYSDGYFSPAEIIDRVSKLDLEAIAVTDHDETGGVNEAIERGREKNIEVLSGIELSVDFQGLDLHLLGYGFDIKDADLTSYLGFFKKGRILRAKRIVEKLVKIGIPISFDAVMEKAGPGTVGRPHIANVLLDEGYVFSFQEAFDKFLATSKLANIGKNKLSLGDALRLISSAGGICSIAHPAIQIGEVVIRELFEKGVQAIEVIHPKHNQKQTAFYSSIASNYQRLITGGSDFHGMTETLGKFVVSMDDVNQLKKSIGR